MYHDENINSEARKWVRENAFNKGNPNKILLASLLPPTSKFDLHCSCISIRRGITKQVASCHHPVRFEFLVVRQDTVVGAYESCGRLPFSSSTFRDDPQRLSSHGRLYIYTSLMVLWLESKVV